MTENNFTPPLELVREWYKPGCEWNCPPWLLKLLTESAQWGADQELEACCEWLGCGWKDIELVDKLRAARRPKPPSLKEQALQVLEDANLDSAHYNIILRALEQLND